MATRAHLDLAKRYSKFPLNTIISDTLIEMFELLFSEEEAQVAAKLSINPATASKMAGRVHRPVHEVQSILDGMAEQGLIVAFGDAADRKYAIMPIAPGIFEAQMSRAPTDDKARRFAELFEEFFCRENVEPMMKRPISAIKVVPIEQSVKNTIGVMYGDQFREAVDHHDTFGLAHACSCRHHKELIGDGCDRPKDVCMAFGKAAEFSANAGFSRLVSREEIMEAIDRAEAAGLVHITDNVETPSFSCNCCACCCGFLAILGKFNLPGVMANSRFVPQIDDDSCKACGKCSKVCPVAALHVYNKTLVFEEWRCIGCGACVPTCKKNNAIKMVTRSKHPGIPENYGQLITLMGSEFLGIQRFTDSLPGFTKFLGNRLQNYMTKK